MWYIDHYEVRSTELDFSSSSQGTYHARQIWVGDVQLVNAVGLVDFKTDPVQVQVCEQCGIVGCAAGGYLRPRRIGDFAIWLPAFDLQSTRGWEAQLYDPWEAQQYAPPKFVVERGAPLISRAVYEQFRGDVERLPQFDDWRPLLAIDAARIVQMDAPLRILGAWPRPPVLLKEHVLAVSDGDLDQECEALQACLDKFTAARDAAVDAVSGGQPVEFHLDGPRFPSWTPMRRHDGFRSLQLNERLSVRITDA